MEPNNLMFVTSPLALTVAAGVGRCIKAYYPRRITLEYDHQDAKGEDVYDF